MQIVLHQTHHQVGDFKEIFQDLSDVLTSASRNQLHLFPELFLSGYPLQDLIMQRPFIENYIQKIDQFNQWSLKQEKKDNVAALIGGPDYHINLESGLPDKIKNCIFLWRPGEKLKNIYSKGLLPNYDIFDEKKYFHSENSPSVLNFGDKNIGLMICEDMWFSGHHSFDPGQELYEYCREKSLQLDLIVNLSASPFFLGKHQKRIQRADEISQYFECPFVYTNRVGGEDEILFDGGSFIQDGEKTIVQSDFFEKRDIQWSYTPYQGIKASHKNKLGHQNTWESLFSPTLDITQSPPLIPEFSDSDCDQVIEALTFGLQDYAQKCGFKKFSIALSGGMDSALVLALAHLSLQKGQTLEAIYMPSRFSSDLSQTLAQELCKNLNISLKVFDISQLHAQIASEFKQNFGDTMQGLADENIQSRLRGALLYARSNQQNTLVINTSNKSEIAVGYSTLYGDSVGALSLLGDLYKTEVYRLSKYINRKYKNIIPLGIIDRPPSAELRENQEDGQSLPPYPLLDSILEGLLSYRLGLKELVDSGHCPEHVKKVYDLYTKSEYKRNQFCPILKLKAKSFGFGYRIPITKKMENLKTT
jgi:NAD+ synthase (glutamine-hydrolysing)